MKRWKKKHRWGVEFEWLPSQEMVFVGHDWNGQYVWNEFATKQNAASAAKYLREVAAKLDELARSE